MDKTASRRPLPNARRAGSSVRAESSNPVERDAAQRRRSTSGAHAQKGKGASRPPQRQRQAQQHARRAAPAQGGKRPASQHAKPVQQQGLRVPIAVVAVLVVVSIVASVLITRGIMISQVKTAQSEAAAAQNKATSLADELEKERKKTTTGTTTTDGQAQGQTTTATPATTGVKSPWLDGTTWTSGDSALDEDVKGFCDDKANTTMAFEDAAMEVYKGIAWSDYVERDTAQHPSGKDWRLQYAKQYYDNGCSGNCYEFSAFLSYCMQYMGYPDAKVEGAEIELQSGNWGDHALVFLTNTDGSKCLLDTARGVDGWMLPETAYNMKIVDFENA